MLGETETSPPGALHPPLFVGAITLPRSPPWVPQHPELESPGHPPRQAQGQGQTCRCEQGRKQILGHKHPQGELAPQLVPTPALGISLCSVRRAASAINSVLRQHGPDPAHGAGTAWEMFIAGGAQGMGGSLPCAARAIGAERDGAGEATWERLDVGFALFAVKTPRVGAPHEGPPRADAGDHGAGIPTHPGTPEVTLRGAPMCRGGPPPRQVPVPQPCRGFSALE